MDVREIKTYRQAEEYTLEVPKFTSKNPLEETRGFYQFLQEHDYKEEKLGKIIHIAGTNGKGSVCSFINPVCLESGYHVGMFTSPHLITMRERFVIDGEIVSEDAFLDAFEIDELPLLAAEHNGHDPVPNGLKQLTFIHFPAALIV